MLLKAVAVSVVMCVYIHVCVQCVGICVPIRLFLRLCKFDKHKLQE